MAVFWNATPCSLGEPQITEPVRKLLSLLGQYLLDDNLISCNSEII
jgi:hypothetical protein